MKITELAIKRPAAMSMVIMFFVVLGLYGYTFIGSELFPKSDQPFVTIIAPYPGAGPEEMENQVTDKIEEAVSSVSGLKQSRSWIYEGLSYTVLEFRMGTDANVAANDTQKAVDAAMPDLPKDMEKPVIQKYDMNSEPVMTIAVGGQKSLAELYDIANDTIKDRLETVPGVASVSIEGGRKREVRVNIDRSRMESYGLAANQIIQLLKAENINIPGGTVKNEKFQYDVRLEGKFKNLEDIKRLPIPLSTGGTVPLQEIATVTDSFADIDQYNRLNEKDAVGLTVQKQSDANIVDTAKAVRQELAELQTTLPKNVNIVISDDSSTFVKNSLADTQRTLFEGVLMTGIVLFLFLREWRSLIIVLLAIPTSIIATFMMMYFFGFTFNILSLMGLSLCVGILVDDSIVVLENIHRHLKMGKSPIQAAIDGRHEIGMAAVAITMSDVVVFGPIAFMQGMVGQMFRQFGLTVVVATLFSLFVSFTLTPMLAAKFYKYVPDEEKDAKANRYWKWFSRKSGRIGDGIVAFYQKLLVWSLRNRLKILAVIMIAVMASLSLAVTGKIGFEFVSPTDQGKFNISIEMPPGSTLDVTDKVVRNIESRLKRVPEVSNTVATVGNSTGVLFNVKSPNLAKINVVLKPKGERSRTVWQVADEVRRWADSYPGAKLNILEAQMPGLNTFEAPVVVEIRGKDMNTLIDLAKKVKGIVQNTLGAEDVRMSWKEDSQPEYQVVINRDKASSVGLTAADLAGALRSSVAGDEASTIKIDNKDIGIWVQVSDYDRKNIDDIGNIPVANRLGQTFLIKQVADVIPGNGPTEIRHKDRERMITVLANNKNVSLSYLEQSFNAGFAKLNIPNGYAIGYDGFIKLMHDSNTDLYKAMALALILVYMILIILYESFLTPIIRMLSMPVGIIGAMVALYITNNTLNMMSLIAIIMLDGLATKNGTLLIDYTNTLMKRGMNLREALVEAGTKRLRPIFMTSVTMIFGMLPTALALADGAEIRKSMGIVLVGGLITSTVLTPILIPVAYTLIDDAKHWVKRRFNKEEGMAVDELTVDS